LGRFENLQDLFKRMPGCPRLDCIIELVVARDSPVIPRESGMWAKSSRPIAVIRRLKIASALPAITT